MQRSTNLMQILQERMIVMMQLKFFTRARRFLDEKKDEGIEILEARFKKERNNYYELVKDMTITHQVSILKHVIKFIVSKAMNFQSITLKIHEVRPRESLDRKGSS